MCSRYLLCEEAIESVNQLLLHCAFTRHIWTMFPTIFGVHWVMPGCIKLPQCSWYKQSTSNDNRYYWIAIPAWLLAFSGSLGWEGQ